MFNKIGLIATPGVEAVKTTLIELLNYLHAHKRHIILDKNCAKLINNDNCEIFDTSELGSKCDLVIAVGGDGTMLRASHALCDFNVPLL